MNWPEFSLVFAFVACTTFAGTLGAEAPDVGAPDVGTSDTGGFGRDVRPILASKCFACHGPDADHRKADLRLDIPGAAVEAGVILPGNPEKSELVKRIFSEDPDERMPHADSNESLSIEEKRVLRDWIKSGARYEAHWAFVPPLRPELPAVRNSKWPRNEIDYFVLSRLERKSLQPSPEADRYTLVRRVYLDLIGLPPDIEAADAFVRNDDPAAYEELVDELLRSSHYGERWARQWLDLARYSDTNGYEKDRPRSIWPYRDWVIKALNSDLPFDQFTIEQLAGDMLPEASRSQKIATGFHRNTMLNEEGGIDPLEYRFYAMVDRVATTGTVWLGLTTGCAQCHTHKYDPISHTEYYQLMALLNNADEPDLRVVDENIGRRRADLEARIETMERALAEQFPPAPGDEPLAERVERNLHKKFEEWLNVEKGRAVDWRILKPETVQSNSPKLEVLEDASIFSSGDITKRDVYKMKFAVEDAAPIAAIRLEVLPDDKLPSRGPGRAYYEGRKGDFFLSELKADFDDVAVKFSSGSVSFGKIGIGSGNAKAENTYDGDGSTGWSTAGREGESHQLVLNLTQPIETNGELDIELLFERHFAASLGRFRFSVTDESKARARSVPVEVEALLASDAESTASELETLRRYFLRVSPDVAEARAKIDELRKKLPSFPETMVLEERPPDNPRETYRHHRGEYLSPRELVKPAVPAVFRGLPEGGPANRLAFARWLVSDRNTLVGRVTVNRAWRAFFGAGIVRTSGDFGTQSSLPTHPLLLDWLATEFVRQGWSLKKLHRSIVMSASYRQSSRMSPAALRMDPGNEWYARGPRLRIDAEMVRDVMLKASGLLSEKMYGPSVYPPQPASVTALAYGNTRWSASSGEDRYRRSLYTFSKRTAPFAAYKVFDGPSGESCMARRNRSNTPLQALTLLNDAMFLEMSRALAKRVASRQDLSITGRARYIFRCFVTRPPDGDELEAMLAYVDHQKHRLQAGELKAADICGEKDASSDLAAWTLLARAVMNFDESITKP